ncbi:zinc-dependent metalloprotease [Aquimarina sp. ERC-38]|uniref:M57 family metalloprotease n=1 Tax=Aquimarina sp. ERC-38 TaxID=2949996 RepID=UPI002247FA87|nr:M57 family metalloprotease [Aquimarina sp. ERC-38]UZO79248.1 zinc-dependent metalloprotease [Aquimarina sp. ERC-38]
MKNFKVLALCALTAGIFYSCEKEESVSEVSTEATTELSEKDQIALIEAGVNPLHAEYYTKEDIDGTLTKGILAGSENFKDIFIALDDLTNQSLSKGSDVETKQYRSNNLVARNSVIDVVGYTGNCSNGRSCALSPVMQQGLRLAINNYNALNISLRFRLTFSSNPNGADIIIFNPGGTNAGGIAEFPSGGRPGDVIRIFGGMNRFNTNVNEHVMTHEIGHALGFRHTDYARRRCDGTNEERPISGFGAIRIPGTPSGNQWNGPNIDSNSIMISCFDNQEDGEFSNFDRIALRTLY